MTSLDFLKEGLKNLRTVGTVTRSSKFVSLAMIEKINLVNAKVIIELGAGDGAITKHILAQIPQDSTLVVFEVNPLFCELLKKLNDPRLIVIEDGAEKMEEHLIKNNITEVDGIISAIPFVVLSEELTYKILNLAKMFLKTNGKFVQLHYSLAKRKTYENVFGNVSVHFITLNIPPAFILVSNKD